MPAATPRRVVQAGVMMPSRLTWAMLWMAFAVHLLRQRRLQEWVLSAVVALQAEVVYPVFMLFISAIAYCYILGAVHPRLLGLEMEGMPGRLVGICLLVFAVSSVWMGMVKMVSLHDLEVLHLAPFANGRFGISIAAPEDVDDGKKLLMPVPIGLFRIASGACVRPWSFLLTGTGTLLASYSPQRGQRLQEMAVSLLKLLAVPMSDETCQSADWWEWREVFIGCLAWVVFVFWMILLPLRYHLGLSWFPFTNFILTGFGVVGIAIVLTTKPLLSFLEFWSRSFVMGLTGDVPPWVQPGQAHSPIQWEERCACFISVWLFACLFLLEIWASVMRDRARRETNRAVRFAVVRPWRAPLSSDFGHDLIHHSAAPSVEEASERCGMRCRRRRRRGDFSSASSTSTAAAVASAAQLRPSPVDLSTMATIAEEAPDEPSSAPASPAGTHRRVSAAEIAGVRDAMRRRASGPVRRRDSLESLRRKQQCLVRARQRMLLEQVADAAMLPSSLRVWVRREQLVKDSLELLYDLPPSELLAKSMTVVYEGEQGVDAGGLTKDWFDSLARALIKEATEPPEEDDQDLFVDDPLFAVASDGTLVPRPVPPYAQMAATAAATQVDSDLEGGSPAWHALRRHQDFYATGRFFALAILRERPLPVSLGLAMRRLMLRKPLNEEAVRDADPDFFKHRVEAVLRPGGLTLVEAALCEPVVFASAPTDLRPTPHELVHGGMEIPVTEENKHEYVQLLCEERICGGAHQELHCFLQGFWDLLPPVLLREQHVTPTELAMFISGAGGLDVEEWRQHSHNSLNSEAKQVIDWFWEVVRFFEIEERRLLLHFTTGSSRLPPGGFADLRPVFTVEVNAESCPSRLPHAHTCVNRIVLQRYTSLSQLKEKLELAIAAESFEMY